MRYPQFCDFAFLLILSLSSTSGIVFACDAQHEDNNGVGELCTSEICQEAGNEIIESLDNSVEPCDDFYQHACGGWIANHPIPDNLEAANQFNVLAMKSQGQLKDMLRENSSSDTVTMRKVKDYYHSCEDLAAIDARGLAPLEAVVSANGGWPLSLPSDQWNLESQNLTLQKIHENYAKISSHSALFSINVRPDLLNSSVRILHLKSPLDPIDRPRWLIPQRNKRDNVVSPYRRYTDAVAKEFARFKGFNVSDADIEDDVQKIFNFQVALPHLSSRDRSGYEVITIADVQSRWNSVASGHPEYAIDWLETIRNRFDGTDIEIDATEKIGIMQGFVEQLAALLISTPLRTVVNYVHWHAIDSFVPATNKEMRDITNNLIKHLYGFEDKDEDRPIFCIGHHKMIEGLSYVYVKKYFGGPLTSAIEMVTQIQTEMKRKFDQSTWMDDEAKFRSKEKVDSVVTNIGYPSWYDEPGKIDEYYSELSVGPNYFENLLSCNRFDLMTSLKLLREPYDRNEAPWAFQPIFVGGAYRSTDNSINIPAVNFQMPFYHAERPIIMNYGSLGFLIGHELSHGFDNNGRHYDKFGNRKQWWSTETIAKYDEKAQCFVDQYSNYTLIENYMNETIKLNGRLTLGENIADNSGVVMVLNAYLTYKNDNNFEDLKVPALRNYSDMQLFFYSLANYFCSSPRPEILAFARTQQVHSPSSIRVNGMVSNMQEFSQAFNCPSGSPMNPEMKCALWD